MTPRLLLPALWRRGLLAAALALPGGLAAQTIAVAGEGVIRTGDINVLDVQAAGLSDSTAVVAWVGCPGETAVCSVWVAEATLSGGQAVTVGTPREVHATGDYVSSLKTRAFRGRLYLAWAEAVREGGEEMRAGNVLRSRFRAARYEPGGGGLTVLQTVEDAGFPSFVADGDSIEALYNVVPPQVLGEYSPPPEASVRGAGGELYRSRQTLPVAVGRVQDADGTLDVFNTIGGVTCVFEAVSRLPTGGVQHLIGGRNAAGTFTDPAFDHCDALAYGVRDGYLLVWRGQPYDGGDEMEYTPPDGSGSAVLTAVLDRQLAPRVGSRILNDRTEGWQYPVHIEPFGERLLVLWQAGDGRAYRFTALSAETGEALPPGRSEPVDDGLLDQNNVHFTRVGDALVATSVCEVDDVTYVTCIRVVRLSVTE